MYQPFEAQFNLIQVDRFYYTLSNFDKARILGYGGTYFATDAL